MTKRFRLAIMIMAWVLIVPAIPIVMWTDSMVLRLIGCFMLLLGGMPAGYLAGWDNRARLPYTSTFR